MRIRTFTDEDAQVYVPAFIYSPSIRANFQKILFLVDTGATTVTILDNDAERLRINFRKLRKLDEKAIGIGGARTIYELPDVTIVLLDEETGGLKAQRLESIDVLRPRKRLSEIPFSLIGTSFLRRFQFSYRMPTLEL